MVFGDDGGGDRDGNGDDLHSCLLCRSIAAAAAAAAAVFARSLLFAWMPENRPQITDTI